MVGAYRGQDWEQGSEETGRDDDLLSPQHAQTPDHLLPQVWIKHGMMAVQELLQVIRKGGGDLGVEVRDMGHQVDGIVKLLDVFSRCCRGGRDEDLSLRVVSQPLYTLTVSRWPPCCDVLSRLLLMLLT